MNYLIIKPITFLVLDEDTNFKMNLATEWSHEIEVNINLLLLENISFIL